MLLLSKGPPSGSLAFPPVGWQGQWSSQHTVPTSVRGYRSGDLIASGQFTPIIGMEAVGEAPLPVFLLLLFCTGIEG